MIFSSFSLNERVRSLCLKKRFVSSANIISSAIFDTLVISFIERMNKRGPKIESWGTSHLPGGIWDLNIVLSYTHSSVLHSSELYSAIGECYPLLPSWVGLGTSLDGRWVGDCFFEVVY